MLVLLDPSFLNSVYCMEEFTVAYNSCMLKSRLRLIVVKANDLQIDDLIKTVPPESRSEENLPLLSADAHFLVIDPSQNNYLSAISTLKDVYKYINVDVAIHVWAEQADRGEMGSGAWKDELLYAMPIEPRQRLATAVDRNECEIANVKPNVFLSFAHDGKIMAIKIMEFLEKVGFKVCFYPRDFHSGRSVVCSYTEAIQLSNRVLCLVTPAFLDSVHCLNEFIMAYNYNITLQRFGLIAIKRVDFRMDDSISVQPEVNRPLPSADDDDDRPRVVDPAQNIATLKDFIARHVYIEVDTATWTTEQADSGVVDTSAEWKNKLLQAMPPKRLERIEFREGSTEAEAAEATLAI